MHLENIIQHSVKPLAPKNFAVLRCRQGDRDTDFFACGSHAAIDHIVDVKLLDQLLYICAACAKINARLPRDYRQLTYHGKFSGDVFKDPIGQKGTVFIFIQIVERQNGKAGFGLRGDFWTCGRSVNAGSGLTAGISFDREHFKV